MDEHRYYTSEAAAEIDRLAIEEHGYSGLELMRAAGTAAFETLRDRILNESIKPRVLIICGSGNNGGDGYVVGERCLKQGWQVTLLALKAPRSKHAQRVKADFIAAGGEVCVPKDDLDQNGYDVVVDALLGIGLRTPPDERAAGLIQRCNELTGFKLALDVPSGLNASTGQAFEPTFDADMTVTFIVDKVGLNTGSGLNFCGLVELADISVTQLVTTKVKESARRLLPYQPSARQSDSHKGSYGHLIVAGANSGMLGAGLLAGEAGLRAGCGKATLLSTAEHLDAAAVYHPELMSLAYTDSIPNQVMSADAIAVGPGLGLDDWSKSLFQSVLGLDKPTIIDADALSLLSSLDELNLTQAVLTPHPGEAARLLGCSNTAVQNNRLHAAAQIASRYRAVCVLKGAGTVVASPQGELWICKAGNPAMASAGMGDVLSGIIGALLAQGHNALEAAQNAVYWHAAVADKLVQAGNLRTLLASDVARGLSIQLEED